ncbi:MAG: Spy/CpxP family protein refolding chaperone [Rhodomicrobium sp.]
MNGRNFAALHNNRAGNTGRLANNGRFNARNGQFGRGNGFANARFGGRGWQGRGFGQYWAGGVFWPYFFGDYFSYAFWPYDYYDLLWGFGPDALLWSAFWPDYDYPYYDYGYYNAAYPGGGTAYAGDIYSRYRHAAVSPSAGAAAQRVAKLSPQETAAACAGFAPGVDSLPFQRIEAIVQPAPDQQQAFEDLKSAMVKASEDLVSACPAQTPSTPEGRLDAMEQRLQAMQQSEAIVRGPLVRLYDQLSPQQRQRLDAAMGTGRRTGERNVDLARLCSSQAGFINVPENDIANAIKLDDTQREALDKLKQASAQAAAGLRSSCPENVPDTLDARLDAADRRIAALIKAIDIVKPEVRTFFASLTSAQKTALNSQAPQTRTASNRR